MEIAIHKFLGNLIIKRLRGINFQNNEEIRSTFEARYGNRSGRMGGRFRTHCSKSEIDRLLDGIENGTINRLKSINACFAEMHENYYTYEWTWAYHKIQEFYGINPEIITAQDVIRIVKSWQESVVGLDKMVYEDAKKEFSLFFYDRIWCGWLAMTRCDKISNRWRGDFESNTFVTAVLETY